MEGRTLDDVLATVDATLLRPAAGPVDDRRVDDVVILDWTDPHALGPGSLVLAVGVQVDGPGGQALIDRSAGAGAVAVVVRCDGELPRALVAAAERAGMPVLAAPLGVTWGQLYALLRTALVRTTGNGAGDAEGVPTGDLFSLADAIATALGGPITIEDPQWRVLAYSNLDQEIDDARRQTILGRVPPPEWQERLDVAGVAQALRRGDGIVRFQGEGLLPRLVAPVRAGGELLGSIWLAVGDATLAPDTEEQLMRASELSAMHLVAYRASEDLKRRARGVPVREVLQGHSPAGHRLPPLPLSPIAFEPRDPDRTQWLGSVERVLSVVSLFAEAAHRDAMCALVQERIWALVPTPAMRPEERLLEVAERVVGRIGEVLDLELVAAVGPPAEEVAALPASRDAAERALRVLARRGDGQVVIHAQDVRAEVILDEWLELAGTRPSLCSGPLSALAEADRDGTRVAALRAYLDAHGDAAAAARRLGVHVNTLRYRLRRSLELTGIDLSAPDERLVAELQLRLVEHN